MQKHSKTEEYLTNLLLEAREVCNKANTDEGGYVLITFMSIGTDDPNVHYSYTGITEDMITALVAVMDNDELVRDIVHSSCVCSSISDLNEDINS